MQKTKGNGEDLLFQQFLKEKKRYFLETEETNNVFLLLPALSLWYCFRELLDLANTQSFKGLMQWGELLKQFSSSFSLASKIQQHISGISHCGGEGGDTEVQKPQVSASQEF